MAQTVYTEGKMYKNNDSLQLNSVMINKELLSIFDTIIDDIKNLESTDNDVTTKSDYTKLCQPLWLLSSKGIFRCSNILNKKYYSPRIFFSSQYHELMMRKNIFEYHLNKIQIEGFTDLDIVKKFYLMTDDVEINYDIIDQKDFYRYLQNDIISTLIYNYLVINNIALFHEQN